MLIDGTELSAVASLLEIRFGEAAGVQPARVISTGLYKLMWDLAKSELPRPNEA